MGRYHGGRVRLGDEPKADYMDSPNPVRRAQNKKKMKTPRSPVVTPGTNKNPANKTKPSGTKMAPIPTMKKTRKKRYQT
jgi:hypothetical protein